MTISNEKPLLDFASFIGQEKIRQSLQTHIDAAKQQVARLPHSLLSASPEMGKATLACAAANELGMSVRSFSVNDGQRVLDLIVILTNLRKDEILLIENVDLIKKPLLDTLVDAMSKHSIDITVGKGLSSRNILLKLPMFTLIATTCNLKKVDRRLLHLMTLYEFGGYSVSQMTGIILNLAARRGLMLELDIAALLAEYSEGCPGSASILFHRVFDHVNTFADRMLTTTTVKDALIALDFEKPVLTSTSSSDEQNWARQPISDEVKIFVWRRDNGRCVKCGGQAKLEYDHIIPISKGGSNTARNIQLLCEYCNRSKGAKIV